MEEKQLTCPKCKGLMARGYIPDFGYGFIAVSGWQEGEPKKSRWFVTKKASKDSLPIASFRCSGCGYIEFYADARFAAK